MADCGCIDGQCGLRVEVYQGPPLETGIYLDHAATTPVDPTVLRAMLPYFREGFGNPSSAHGVGRQARDAVEQARQTVARCLGARAEEILFTSGGTEANNTVLQGVAAAAGGNTHVITSSVEHHAVLETCEYLETRGIHVTVLPVDEYGLVDPEDVRHAITPRTALVSIMHANNEIGTVQPVREIGRICSEAGIPFHTDAVQTAGSLPVNVEELGVDFLSLSGHKLYGPKGIGVLYARRGSQWHPLLHGGSQERRRRAGTENVPGIVGLAAALELSVSKLAAEAERLSALRDRLIEAILSGLGGCRLNGHPRRRLPNNAHFSLEGTEGEAILTNLDMMGIAASTGSACTSGSPDPSHVLRAIRVPLSAIRGSVRFSLGRETTEEQVDFAADAFITTVEGIRALVPNYQPAPL